MMKTRLFQGVTARRQKSRRSFLSGHTRLALESLEDRSLLSAGSLTLSTDKADYSPGQTVLIETDQFAPGETVDLQVLHTDGKPNTGAAHEVWRAMADDGGCLYTTWLVADDSIGSTLQVTAKGESSGTTLSAAFTDSLQGAIFTTNADGSTVDQNLYASKSDVYLNGGPNKNGTGHLPEGNYYFQVTDPSGSQLLSSDDIARRELHIDADGFVDAYLGGTHTTGIDAAANGGAGAVTVQLMPYDDTPNPGGEYKVWLTPVADYDPDATQNFGFHESDSKTDNFKVKTFLDPKWCGHKFEDHNGNGIQDPHDQGLPGWHILLDGVDSAVTDSNGDYCILDVQPGTHTVQEVLQNDWVQTYGIGGYTMQTQSGVDTNNLDFGNFQLGSIHGIKYTDVDGDPTTTLDDTPLAGWTIHITGQPDQVTGQSGEFSVSGLGPGTYIISEQGRPGWVQTAGGTSVTIASGQEYVAFKGEALLPRDSTKVEIIDAGLAFRNFQLGSIRGIKYTDVDGDPTTTADDTPLAGVVIDVNGVAAAVTGPDGQFSIGNLGPGTYVVQEELPVGYVQTAGGDSFTLHSGEEHVAFAGQAGTLPVGKTEVVDAGLAFRNFQLGSIHGIKFEDHNGNGQQDPGDGAVPNWQFYLDTNHDGKYEVGEPTKFTDAFGNYSFTGLGPGTYDVREVLQPNWIQTAGGATVTIRSGQEYVARTGEAMLPPRSTKIEVVAPTLAFGNAHIGRENGLTKGFYTNQNGQRALTGSRTGQYLTSSLYNKLVALLANPDKPGFLVLVDGNGNYQPASWLSLYNNVASYLQAATATNMAFMLSAQMLATEFNVCLGFIDATTSIYVPAVGMGLSLQNSLTAHGVSSATGFAKVQDVFNAAIAELRVAPTAIMAGADRDFEEALKDCFDAMNNNLPIFVI